MGKIQGVTNLPPLKKSRPRDLVAQGVKPEYSPFEETVSHSGFLFTFVFCSRWLLGLTAWL
jgi:hypothetical protein